MHKNQIKYIAGIALIILLIAIVYMIINFKINNQKTNNTLDISLYRVEDIIKRNIDNREILKANGNILVGYSKKELENGYYDLKLCKEREGLNIYVNKAWKKFNDTLYEEEYVNQLVRSIIDIFEIQVKEAEKQIYAYIIEGYIMSKGIIYSSLNNEDTLKVEEVELKRDIVNSELILSISKEVDK